MKQLWTGMLVIAVGIAAIVFNRFAAEESVAFRERWPRFWWTWRPSLALARILIIIWGLVVIFLGLAIIVHE